MPKNSSFELLVLYGLYTVTFTKIPKKYVHCKEMAKTELFDIPVTVEENGIKRIILKTTKWRKKF